MAYVTTSVDDDDDTAEPRSLNEVIAKYVLQTGQVRHRQTFRVGLFSDVICLSLHAVGRFRLNRWFIFVDIYL